MGHAVPAATPDMMIGPFRVYTKENYWGILTKPIALAKSIALVAQLCRSANATLRTFSASTSLCAVAVRVMEPNDARSAIWMRSVSSHFTEGRSVQTTGLPAARYSSVLRGNDARLNAESAYGVTPTSIARRYAATFSKGTG